MKLYSAPMNLYSNHVFRHLLLKNGADKVFSEMIQLRYTNKIGEMSKYQVISGDEKNTVIQFALSDVTEFGDVLSKIPSVPEINLNVDCPHSSMKLHKVCGGLLHHEEHLAKLMKDFGKHVSDAGFIPSVKIRLGTDSETIRIKEYLSMMQNAGIKKAYVHARTLRWPYEKPAMHNHLVGLKDDLPDIDLVINGDIDCYDSYLKLVDGVKNDGVMIGRAALSNPLIFRQIRDGIKVDPRNYDPVKNDPNLEDIGPDTFMSEKKKAVINDFLELCKEHDLRFELIRWNMSYMMKGITGARKVMKEINQADSIDSINMIFNKL